MSKNRGLGRGLSALMAEVPVDGDAATGSPETLQSADRTVPIEAVEPNPDQPRKDFKRDALEDLASSIRAKGILQPLIVRPSPRASGKFEIVAGERRWRAAQLAKLHEVPIIERELDDLAMLEIAIIENVQRADLNPVEEGLGYRALIDRFGHTQEKLASSLGKSRSHIANSMRLLNLPDEVLSMVREGSLTSGHARALITADNPAELARKVIAKGLSVRETERLAKAEAPARQKTRSSAKSEKDADTQALESDLSANLGLKVDIRHQEGDGAGSMTLSYSNLDQLDALCRILSSAPLGE
ncbi:ParB/RepB/Spo0J family partition protein [Roseicyclus sp. F158]|uniref:ParB/RepB/Spo0J family partition protein n=1 Tax=Tropicimonas omnivorans TaxID=3075590 RepID=A0ABU3DCQ6_9RHOB|nr:ParB/RepB/Spo0J family partition protein [Roseicyclus sp. F158]MDT0681486.1 ParB/RepB/Spo0J family partition protein [Roseicyclus sp. F158]